jgi:hypothetical protein
VSTGIKGVNEKVDSLGRSVEETQERTRKNEGAVGDVDKKTQAAQNAADRSARVMCRRRRFRSEGRARESRRGRRQGRRAGQSVEAARHTVVLSEDEASSSSARRGSPTKPRPSSTSW